MQNASVRESDWEGRMAKQHIADDALGVLTCAWFFSRASEYMKHEFPLLELEKLDRTLLSSSFALPLCTVLIL